MEVYFFLFDTLFIAEVLFLICLGCLVALMPFLAVIIIREYFNINEGNDNILSSKIFEMKTELQELEQKITNMEKQQSFMYKKFMELWQDEYSKRNEK
jgi:hypothetical protein